MEEHEVEAKLAAYNVGTPSNLPRSPVHWWTEPERFPDSRSRHVDLTAVTALRAAHGIFRNDVLITPRTDEHGMHFSQVPFGSFEN
jgi:hypothetical protein